jgi:hypothetical protein
METIMSDEEKAEQQTAIAEAYREAAREQCRDGELEVDDGAVVSFGGDPGAYVAAWIWVSDEDAGIKQCARCDRTEVNPPDAADWIEDFEDNVLCPQCAAKYEDEQKEVK